MSSSTPRRTHRQQPRTIPYQQQVILRENEFDMCPLSSTKCLLALTH